MSNKKIVTKEEYQARFEEHKKALLRWLGDKRVAKDLYKRPIIYFVERGYRASEFTYLIDAYVLLDNEPAKISHRLAFLTNNSFDGECAMVESGGEDVYEVLTIELSRALFGQDYGKLVQKKFY